MKSTSSEKNINFFSKVVYALKLLHMRTKDDGSQSLIPWADINEYEIFLSNYVIDNKVSLEDHSILEIGYGARPWRLISMTSLGIDISGIDLDRPTYGVNPERLLQVLKKNGLERFLKSLVRGLLYDRADLKKLEKELKVLNKSLQLDESRMIVGSASDSKHFLPASFTFAFSEDVFEHIPPEILPQVIKNMKFWLKPGSIAIVRPHVYTGISGGHDPDLYPHKIMAQTFPPHKAWSHLLDSDFKVNTYLNKVRLPDYIQLFSKHFEILEIKQKYNQLGKQYLTPEIREKLIPFYTEEELLTNQVAFVLRA